MLTSAELKARKEVEKLYCSVDYKPGVTERFALGDIAADVKALLEEGGSSEECSSDSAFAARHNPLEQEEISRFLGPA